MDATALYNAYVGGKFARINKQNGIAIANQVER
jgi:hypothetical protein